MKKNKDIKLETPEDFLARGGEVEMLSAGTDSHKSVISSSNSKKINLLSLTEAEELYGEKLKRNIKHKKIDVSNVDLDLIPEHIKRLILSKVDSDITKEEE